jgi:hypothetical protein
VFGRGKPCFECQDGVGFYLKSVPGQLQRTLRAAVVKLLRGCFLMGYTHAQSIAQYLKQKTCQTQKIEPQRHPVALAID